MDNLKPENDKRNYLNSEAWFETMQEEIFRQEYTKRNVDLIEDVDSKTLANKWLEHNTAITKIYILPQRTFITFVCICG
jgi:hypothetical protein